METVLSLIAMERDGMQRKVSEKEFLNFLLLSVVFPCLQLLSINLFKEIEC